MLWVLRAKKHQKAQDLQQIFFHLKTTTEAVVWNRLLSSKKNDSTISIYDLVSSESEKDAQSQSMDRYQSQMTWLVSNVKKTFEYR